MPIASAVTCRMLLFVIFKISANIAMQRLYVACKAAKQYFFLTPFGGSTPAVEKLSKQKAGQQAFGKCTSQAFATSY